MSEYQEPAPAYPHQHAQPKKGKGCLIAALVVGLLGLLMFGGCMGMAWFGISKVGEMAKTELQADPTVANAVGEVQEAKMDLIATGEVNQGAAGGGDIIVYKVTGTKGSGKAKVRMNESTGAMEILEFVPDP